MTSEELAILRRDGRSRGHDVGRWLTQLTIHRLRQGGRHYVSLLEICQSGSGGRRRVKKLWWDMLVYWKSLTGELP